MSSTPRVRAGFVPLLDAAVLMAAVEMGFAEREGLALELVREASWANIRDRLAFRQFEVAHLLGPMAVAAQLGIGTNPYPLIAPMALGQGGNAITLSTGLFARMEATGEAAGEDAAGHARALARVVAERRADGLPPLVLGVTYPFSSHNYEFRFWLAGGGIDPDRDVTMTVVPPPLTADALASGAIDGFCVNAPWNLLAVEAGVGRIVAVKADIWPASPEKVLGMRPDWAEANRDTVARLVTALDRAARWCDDPANHGTLAEIMALPAYVGAPLPAIRSVLAGRLALDGRGAARTIPDYMTFHRNAATFPWKSQALWVYTQMVRWGQVAASPENQRLAASAFRPDLYRMALAGTGADLPEADVRIERAATLDDQDFDPARIADDIADPAARGFDAEKRAGD